MVAPVPDLRVAICRRCRWPNRIALGAAPDSALLQCGRELVASGDVHAHVRLSQCLNSCDGGHTVRLEYRGWEFAFVGIRTEEELQQLMQAAGTVVNLPAPIAGRLDRVPGTESPLPAWLDKRLYQVWLDGVMLWHRAT